MANYYATIELIVEADSDGEAADSISGLLSEHGMKINNPYGNVIDWQYKTNPETVNVPEDYQPDDKPFPRPNRFVL